MTRTRLPCPACKEVDPRRPADDICDGCRALLNNARALLAAADEVRRRAHQLYRFDPGQQGHPGFYSRDYDFENHYASHKEPHDVLRAALGDLISTMHDPRTAPKIDAGWYGQVLGQNNAWGEDGDGDEVLFHHPKNKLRQRGSSDTPRGRVRLTVEQAIALRRLDAAIDRALASTYKGGRSSGENLVGRLARGEVSVTDYVDVIAERKKEDEEDDGEG